jgi:hypothetical protein
VPVADVAAEAAEVVDGSELVDVVAVVSSRGGS